MKIIHFIVYLMISPLSIYAECNLKTDIVKNPNGSRTYSEECHLLMGDWKKDLEKAEQEIVKLEQAIKLKDLAIVDYEKRVDLWRDTSFNLESKLTTIERFQTTDRWIMFGMGVATTVLSVWAAGQLK